MKFKFSFLAFLATLIFSISLQATPQKKRNQTSTAKPVTIDTVKIDYSKHNAPVVPFTDTLFLVYGNIGAISPQKRAESIEENIKKLAKDRLFNSDSLKIEIEGATYLITYDGKTIMGINDTQAEVLEKTKSELSHEYIDIIGESINQELSRTSWQNILKTIGLSLLILLVTYLALKYLNRGYRVLRYYISQQKKLTIDKLSFILDPGKQIGVILFFLKLLRLFGVLVILYFCLYTFLALFPETEWLAETLIGYVLSPLKTAYNAIISFIPNLFAIIVIFILFRFLIKSLKIVTDRIGDGSITISGFYPDWAEPTFGIVKVILYAFMIILIFPFLPVYDSKAFQGVSVFLGILFSLGSTSIIANIVSGIVITYMRPFKMGDRIKMGEFSGNVIEKTPLVTRLRTPKNEIITIPNGTIMSAQTINYTQSADEYGLVLYTTITMGYDIPWRKVHELLIEAGLNTPKVMDSPKPFVLQLALDDFYVQYQINVYTKDANAMSAIYSDLNKNIQDIFHREGIELLSPHFKAIRDGSEINMPKENQKTGLDRIAPFNMKVQITKEDDNN